jgi:6-pyruvoyltetrahydropterin/6-carboxytetrahydropterin synthase
MIEIFKEFTFEAAHHLAANVEAGHAYGRLHGHSYRAEIHLRGEPDPATGWIVDFAVLDRAIEEIRERLDHNYLNDVAGLERPTLETIARWIYERLKPTLPQLHRIVVRRGASGEGCLYQPG